MSAFKLCVEIQQYKMEITSAAEHFRRCVLYVVMVCVCVRVHACVLYVVMVCACVRVCVRACVHVCVQ